VLLSYYGYEAEPPNARGLPASREHKLWGPSTATCQERGLTHKRVTRGRAPCTGVGRQEKGGGR